MEISPTITKCLVTTSLAGLTIASGIGMAVTASTAAKVALGILGVVSFGSSCGSIYAAFADGSDTNEGYFKNLRTGIAIGTAGVIQYIASEIFAQAVQRLAEAVVDGITRALGGTPPQTIRFR